MKVYKGRMWIMLAQQRHGLLYWSAFNVRHARRVFGIWRGMMN